MRFRSYDTLRIFLTVAEAGGFTAAADVLHLTKGAVSYRIKRLEEELGFPVFDRLHREIALTPKGRDLLQIAEAAFRELDRNIAALQEDDSDDITIATSTYFASRWLSPRLMTFMAAHPNIGLHLQPLVNLMDLRNSGADVVIRWGDGRWTDRESELLFPCPSFPTAGGALAERIAKTGLRAVFAEVPLLHDRDDSTAWEDWSRAAGLPYTPKRNPLVIPDPNVRVQAVIDGQGVALNDVLVADEIAAGRMARVSRIGLVAYGYHLVFPKPGGPEAGRVAFREWIMEEARVWAERPLQH